MSESVVLSRFVPGYKFVLSVQPSKWSIVSWFGGNVGLWYANCDAMLLFFHDPNIQVDVVE